MVYRRLYIYKLTGDKNISTGKCQTFKYFYRKIIDYPRSPLHKYKDKIDQATYHKIVDTFGDCIYEKIMDGGMYYFPCRHFGRLYIQVIDSKAKNKEGKFKNNRNALLGVNEYRLTWNRRKFKNQYFAMPLLRQTWDNCLKFINDATESNNMFTQLQERIRS